MRKALRWTLGVALIAFAVGIVFDQIGPSNGPGCGSDSAAFVVFEDFVEGQLEAPRLAKFPDYTAASITLLDPETCKWRVRSYVESENSVGTMTRATYVAVMRKSGNRWTLESLSMS